MSLPLFSFRKSPTWFLCVLVIVAAGLAPAMFGQATNATGNIQGTVTDPTGAVVSDAKITITNQDTAQAMASTTNSSGLYNSGAILPGRYKVRVEAKGFHTSELPVTVQVGVVSPSNIKLEVGESSQVVEVEASQLQVNTEQATIQGVINSTQIENLPVNGRNFLDLAQLEPGVQIQDGGNFDPTKNGFSSISFGGRFGRTARVEVDGVDISDETVGTVTQNIPQGAIQEFQLAESMLDLSTELTSSGSVNVTTKSGTNGYHGEGFYYFRDQVLDANLPAASHNPFQRNQYGGNFGGALIKNKLFFFLDAERTKQDFIDPVIPGPPFEALTGNFNSPFREAEGIGRLDWQINNNFKLFYRFSYDQNKSTLPYIPNSFQPFANVNHTPVHAVGLDFATGGFTHSIRFGYTYFRNAITDATTGSNIFNPVPGIELAIGADANCLNAGADVFCSGPSFLAPQATSQSDHQFKYDGSKAWRTHILRYGGGINHIQGGGYASFLALGPAVGAGVADCNAACLALPGGISNPANYPANNVTLGNGQGYPSLEPAFNFPAGGLGPDNRLSLYAGDSWKVKPNFTLTYGLRYVRDTGRSDSDLPAIPALEQFGAGLGARVHQPNTNFAPQVGFAFDPSNNGKSVIRGGIGLFYENSVWNNTLFDRPARLPQGLFLAQTPICSGGSGGVTTLPDGSSFDSSNVCGQPIVNVASQILTYQQQYQAATLAAGPASNPVFIGNALEDGIDATGTNLFAPGYRTPRSVQMNIGIQHEFRKGTVFSADYLRNISTHTLLTVDTNHVGAARFFNPTAALAAINATVTPAGCAPATSAGASSQAAINCYLAAVPTAGIADFAANGLDSGANFCFGAPCPDAACPGANSSLGTNQMLFPIGRSVYNGLQLSLKQDVSNPFRGMKHLNFQVSYSFSKYVSTASDSDFINFAIDNDNPLKYIGPNGLDRRHQLSFGGIAELPGGFQITTIGHFYSPLSQTLTLNTTGNPGDIFVTDVTGDGTEGSGVSSGGIGDVLPGTNLGSFGRSVTPSNLNKVIANYNANFAGQPTPAGQALLTANLFTQTQLTDLGGVMQTVAAAPANEAGMDWLRGFDLGLSWNYKVKERVSLQPGVTIFNVLNFANFDSASNPLSGVLSGTPGSANGTAGLQPNANRVGLGSGVFGLGSPRVIEFSLKLSF